MDPFLKENLITTKDASELSGYTSDYLARLARSGKIAGKRIGHSWLVERESLTRFLDQQGNHKIDRARALARARETEYRAHRSLINRTAKTLTSPVQMPKFGIGHQTDILSDIHIRKSSFVSHALALSTAMVIVVSGAVVANAGAVSELATRAAAGIEEVSAGFDATFGNIPTNIAARIGTVTDAMSAVAPRVAVRNANTTANITPPLADIDLASWQTALGENKNIHVASQRRISIPAVSSTSANVSRITRDDIQSAARTAYEIFTSPTRAATAFAHAYVSVGTDAYAAINSSLSAYRALVETSGTHALSFAAATRDLFAASPRFVDRVNLALGAAIIDLTHAAIRAEVATAYGVAVAAPESARATVALIGGTGDLLARGTSRLPALAASLYLGATEAPARLAPAIAEAVFNAEYAGAARFVAVTNHVTGGYLALLTSSGAMLAPLGTSAPRTLADLWSASQAGLAHAPVALEDAYLGALGKSALALETVVRVPTVAAVLSTIQTTSAPLVAAVLPTLTVGERIALATYETIHDFITSAGRALAMLFSPPTYVFPTPGPQRTMSTTTRIAVTNILQGVTADFLNRSLASLRLEILSTIAAQTTSNTIVHYNDARSGAIYDGGTFDRGTMTNGVAVTATTGAFDTLTVTDQSSAAYFTASSLTATSTFAGPLAIGTTTPYGDGLLTVGVNSPLLYVSSNSGRIGIGTTSPEALFSLAQPTDGTTMISAYRAPVAVGDFIQYKAGDGTMLFRVDNSGNLLAGGIINSGSQTVTSISQPQFRLQYDPTNELTFSTGPTGTTTLTVNGSSPGLFFAPQSGKDSVNMFNFTDSATNSVLSIDTLNRRVGIGTTSPSQLLTVGNNNQFTIDSSGNVVAAGSISGTTIYASSAVIGTNSGILYLGGSSATILVAAGVFGPITDVSQDLGLYNRQWRNAYIGGNVRVGATYAALNIAGPTSGMIIEGNVGIGTTSPLSRLSIQGEGATSATSALNVTNSTGASKLFVRNDGNVGIGTTNPSQILDIKSSATNGDRIVMQYSDGASNYFYPVFRDSTSGHNKWGFGVFADSYNETDVQNSFSIYQYYDKDELAVDQYRFIINNDGNVGIGTVTPKGKLDVQPGVVYTPGLLASSALHIDNGTQINSISQLSFGYTAGATLTNATAYISYLSTNSAGNGAGALVFGTRNVTTDDLPSERLRISSTGGLSVGNNTWNGTDPGAGNVTIQGNVGIGTTSPVALLSLGNGSGAAGTTAALGMNFGDPTANLYRSAAGTIKTDGNLYIVGGLGVNVAAAANQAIVTNRILTGNVDAYGLQVNVAGASDVTTSVQGVYSKVTSATAAYTLANAYAFHAVGPGVGAGSAITTAYGLYIDQQKQTGVGTGYGIYQSASADVNYFAGNVGIGDTAPAASLSVAGNVAIGYASGAVPASVDDLSYKTAVAGFKTAGGVAFSNQLVVVDRTGQGVGIGGGISFAGHYTGVDATYIVTGAIDTYKENFDGVDFAMRFVTRGGPTNEKMRISGAGNVGIGTTSPSSLLSVHGTSYFSGTGFFGGAVTATSSITAASFIPTSATVPTNGMYLPAANTLGWASDSHKMLTLDYNTGYLTFEMTNDNNPIFQFKSNNVSRAYLVGNSASLSIGTNSGTNLPIIFLPNGVEAMRIISGGNVGIGTSTPASILDIYGTDAVHLPVGTNAQRPAMALIGQVRFNTDAHQFEGYNDSAVWQGIGGVINPALSAKITAGTDDFLRFYTNSLERMTVSDTGLVGIGTTSPYTSLAVAGASGVLANIFTATSTTATSTFAGGATFAVSGGNVGIGTMSPASKLTVAGDIRMTSSGIFYFPDNTFMTTASIGTASALVAAVDATVQSDSDANSTGDITFKTGVTDRFHILNNGNIGISNTAPLYRLSVYSTDATTNLFQVATTTNTGIFVVNADGYVGVGSSTPSQLLSVAGTIYTTGGIQFPDGSLQTAAAASATSGTTGQVPYYASASASLTATSSIFIATSGNVGIGTTTPDTLLHVYQGTANTNAAKLTINNTTSLTGLRIHNIDTTSSANSSMLFSFIDYDDASIRLAGGVQVGVEQLWSSTASTRDSYMGLHVRLDATDVEALRITSTGNVGIGTTSPSRKFEVAGNSTPGIRVTSTGATVQNEMLADDNAGYFGTNSNHAVIFNTNGLERIRILAGGNVGIGTTDPGAKLEVSGTLLSQDMIRYQGSSNAPSGASGVGGELFTASGNVYLQSYNRTTSVYTPLLFYGSTIGLMNGNVGIGTTNPGSKLEVNGDIKITASSGGRLIFQDGSSMSAAAGGGGVGVTSWDDLTYTTGGAINFQTGNGTATSTKVTITNAGLVGIGTASPVALLTLGGSTPEIGVDTTDGSDTKFVFLTSGSATGANRGAYVAAYGNENASAGFKGRLTLAAGNSYTSSTDGSVVLNYGANVAGMILDHSGNIGIGTTSPTALLHVSNTNGNSVVNIDATNGLPYMQFRLGGSTKWQFGQNVSDSGSSNDLQFYSAGIPGGVLSLGYATGNVGIGTTTPDTLLSVNGTTKLGNGAWPTDTMIITGQRVGIFSSGEDAYLFLGNMQAGVAADRAGELRLGARGTTATNDFAYSRIIGARDSAVSGTMSTYLRFDTGNAAGTPVERMRIDSAGNVGIGTTSPNVKLNINGTEATIAALGSTPNGILTLGAPTTSGIMNFGVYSGQYSWIQVRDTTSSGAYPLALNPLGGNVGIGTTSPAQKLHIQGSGNTADLVIDNTSRGGTAGFYQNWTRSGIVGVSGQWEGDTSTDMVLAADTGKGIRFYVNGTDQTGTSLMRITSAGNVGIGTTTPDFLGGKLVVQGATGARVDINSNTATNQQLLSFDQAGVAQWQIVSDYSANGTQEFDIRDPVAGANRLHINSSGNVGIGTTTPTSQLQVVSAGTYTTTFNNTAQDTRIELQQNGTQIGQISVASNKMNIFGTANVPMVLYTNSSERMRIDSTGNVGIGTTNPGSKLEVNGDITITAASGGRLIFQDGSSMSAASGGGGVGTTSWGDLTYTTGGAINFQTGDGSATSTKVTITNAGLVGIGTTNPTAGKLQVAGSVSATGGLAADVANMISMDYVGTSYGRIYVNGPDTSTNGTLRFVTVRSNGSNSLTPMVIDSAGNVGIGTTSPSALLNLYKTANYSIALDGTTGMGRYISFQNGGSEFGYVGDGSSSDDLIRLSGNNGVRILSNSINALNIDTSGNVGIGTTTPGEKLVVRGDSANIALEANATSQVLGLKWRNYVGDIIASITSNTGVGDFTFNAFGAASAMTIKATTGSVGIGTTTPDAQSKLNVYGDVLIGNNSGFDYLMVGGSSAADHSAILGYDNANNYLNLYISGDGGGTSGIVVANGGNVGIGTTSPGYKLNAVGGVDLTPVLFESVQSANSNNFALQLLTTVNSGAGSGSLSEILGFSAESATNGTNQEIARITALQTTATAGAQTSDLRFQTWNAGSSNTGMILKGSGNVGIGTASPGSALEVNGDIKITAASGGRLIFQDGSSMSAATGGGGVGVTSWGDLTYTTGGAINFQTGNGTATSTKLTITNAGLVGIGTASPGTLLDVSKSQNAETAFRVVNATSGTGAYSQFKLQADGTLITAFSTFSTGYTTSGQYLASSGQLQSSATLTNGLVLSVESATAPMTFWTANGSERMRITAAGNVGIGTTSPANTVEIATATNGKGLTINNTGNNGTPTLRLYSSLGNANMRNWAIALNLGGYGDIGFMESNAKDGDPYAAGTTRFLIQTGGNVGIGTTSPSQALSVQGNGLFSGNLSAANITATGTLAVAGATTFTGSVTYTGGLTQTSTSTATAFVASTAGAAGAPAFTFSSDLTTGMWSPSASTLAFSTAGAERLRIDASGYLGIGVTTPAAMVDISSPNTVTAFRIGNSTNSNATMLTVGSASNNTNLSMYNSASTLTNYLTTSGSSYVNGGSFGVGTTSPYSILSISNSAGTAANTPLFAIASTTAGTATSTLMTVLANGNIGIGTNSPARKLTLYEGTAAATQEIRMDGTTNTVHRLAWDVGNKYLEYSQVTGSITFANASAADFVIKNTGNVGIGTTTPGAPLTVAAASNASSIRILGRLADNASVLEFRTNSDNAYTGFVQADTNGLNFGAGVSGATRMIIASTTGNVGIGTTSPAYSLTVRGLGSTIANFEGNTGNGAGITIGSAGPGETQWLLGPGMNDLSNTNDFGFGNGGLNKLVIQSTGNVGIGTTSPTALLSLANNSTQFVTASIDNAGGRGALLRFTASGVPTGYVGSSGLWEGDTSGDMSLIANDGKQLRFYTNGTAVEAMTINTSGNVGIGTTSPETALDVYGSDKAIQISGGGGVGKEARLGASGNDGYLDLYQGTAPSTLKIHLSAFGNNYLNPASGNVGIGTTTPTDVLTVAGNVRLSFQGATNTGGMLDSYDANGTRVGLIAFGQSLAAAGVGDSIFYQALAGKKLYVQNVSNGVYLNQADIAWNGNSDERLKTNITPLTSATGLEAIRQLTPVTFNWKDASQNAAAGQQLGFIAQNVQQVLPQLVSTSGTITMTLADGTTQTVTNALGLNYTGLIMPAIEAIKELDARTLFTQNAATTTVLTVDVAGKVGIGTAAPQHTLDVVGDIGAIGFVNTSMRSAKTDISYITASTTDTMLNQLVNLKVATYRYKIEDQQDPLRLGFIAEDTQTIAPEILSVDGKGVDLYKFATFTLAGVQALAARVESQNMRLASLESRVTALENGSISAASGSPVTITTTSLASAMNAFGAFISKGFAQFGTLIADRFVAATNSAGTSSAGTVTIITGNTVAQVTNAYVVPTSKVFVTFNSQITGSWWVSDKTAGSFRVVLSQAQATDVSFDYFLVQTEGQIATSTPQTQNIENGISNITNTNTGGTTAAPVITLLGDNPLHISVGGTFVEPGVSVSNGAPYVTFVNGVEQTISSTTISTASAATFTITYKATDSAGNVGTAIRSVIIGNPDSTTSTSTSGTTSPSTDTTAPVVTLTGAAALELTVGDTFTDPGATATDDTDGDLTAKIAVTGSMDAATAGSYTLTYSATDAAGNTGSVSRLVTVIAASTSTSGTTTTTDTSSTTTAPAPEPAPAPSDTTTTTTTDTSTTSAPADSTTTTTP